MSGHLVLEVKPVAGDGSWSREALARAVVPATAFPNEVVGQEAQEKAVLRRTPWNWKDPRGLFGYSKDCEWKDLYVYFDHGDTDSPVNLAATRAFRMYGLDGAMGEPNWREIRGSCIIVRGDPPQFFNPGTGTTEPVKAEYSRDHSPLITVAEMVETLFFFHDKDARKVALMRDAKRLGNASGFPAAALAAGSQPGKGATYVGAAGARKVAKVLGADKRECAMCGKDQPAAGGNLMKCTGCSTVFYCNKECQKADWKRHKKECRQR